MPTEHINEKENLKSGTVKLNKAIDQANKAEIDSSEALGTANQALSNSEQTQKELTQAILEGDSSPLGGQLSVGADGFVHFGPQERFITEYNRHAEVLEETLKFPILSFEIESEIEKRGLPYFHVERYGAKGDYDPNTGVGTDDTFAFQRAIDSAIRAEGGVIELDIKNYLITGTLFANFNPNFPIYFYCKAKSLWRGACVYKETAGDFLWVNLNPDGSSYNDPATQVYNFGMENITFLSKTLVAGNAIKMFRVRSIMKGLASYGLKSLITQTPADVLGNANYCDMSEYDDLNVNFSTDRGIELNKPDCSRIGRYYFHNPEPTCTSAIIIRNGGSWKIEFPLFAYHFDNDGVSPTNTNAYIKISGAYSYEIEKIYVERTHMSNLIYETQCRNGKIGTVYERFVGNNTFLFDNCENMIVEDVYLHSSKNAGFSDIQFTGTNNNIHIEKYMIRDYNTDAKRNLIVSGTLPSKLTGEKIQVAIFYDGTAWRVTDLLGNDLTPILGTPVWTNNDGVEFPSTSLFRSGNLEGLFHKYVSATTLPHMPVINVPESKRIAFMDYSTGTRSQTQSTKMACIANINIPIAS